MFFLSVHFLDFIDLTIQATNEKLLLFYLLFHNIIIIENLKIDVILFNVIHKHLMQNTF